MKKVYLVDSENVGDVWVPLLVSSQAEDVVLVFYTQKSPYMNYENVRLLKETEKEAVFIKCFEGSNALDFQLVTELGYRLRDASDCEYVIVSNDTGFDAAVRYWTAKKMAVSRLSGKECFRQVTGKGQKIEPVAEEPVKKEQSEEAVIEPVSPIEEIQETPVIEVPVSEESIRNLCKCISKDSLADFHNALVIFFGEERGKSLYQEIKGNSELNAYWAGLSESNQEEKFDIYCKMVFELSELANDYPEDFSAFLFKANVKRKNLNSLRAALQGHYGKEKGMKYYSLIKSHIKIMNRM